MGFIPTFMTPEKPTWGGQIDCKTCGFGFVTSGVPSNKELIQVFKEKIASHNNCKKPDWAIKVRLGTFDFSDDLVPLFNNSGLEMIATRLETLIQMIDSNQIQSKAWLALLLERESITQDKFDELMELLRSFGRQKGLKTD